jgi:hypothetical protein
MTAAAKAPGVQARAATAFCAMLFTSAVLALGYVLLGLIPMWLFAFGFLSGLVLWLLVPTNVTFQAIRLPYFITLAFFVLHKVEERVTDFFPALSTITGVPTPEPSLATATLWAFAAAWLLIPTLVARDVAFGYFLAWTFFASMGITELGHFVLPLFVDAGYGYFPGMASVVLLAPTAWWGLFRLVRRIPAER